MTRRLLLTIAALLCASWALAQQPLEEQLRWALAAATPQETLERLEKAVSLGNVLAAYELGLILRDGRAGIAPDPGRALKLFQRAGRPWLARNWFKLGVPEAQYAAGMMHLEGKGTQTDVEAAVKWLLRAAEQGHGQAQVRLAEVYASDGAPVDMREAYFWASLALTQLFLPQEERDTAAQIRERAAQTLGEGATEKIKMAVERWSPRRMASGW
ncbi:tetratricopeptide repeat protein [Pelomicrobium sp.]|jgi:TPR repeat protein|uniref:tetratricopeptide repeat protein n=1 Tax=Pelomicrobium sp. TaxID=2815319 RepID=UPI002FDCAFE1